MDHPSALHLEPRKVPTFVCRYPPTLCHPFAQWARLHFGSRHHWRPFLHRPRDRAGKKCLREESEYSRALRFGLQGRPGFTTDMARHHWGGSTDVIFIISPGYVNRGLIYTFTVLDSCRVDTHLLHLIFPNVGRIPGGCSWARVEPDTVVDTLYPYYHFAPPRLLIIMPLFRAPPPPKGVVAQTLSAILHSPRGAGQ